MMASVGTNSGAAVRTLPSKNLSTPQRATSSTTPRSTPRSKLKNTPKRGFHQNVLFNHCVHYLEQGPYLDEDAFLAWWAKKKSGHDFARLKDKDQNTLLHISLWHKCNEIVVKTLMKSWPEAVRELDREGDTPLHFAVVFNAAPTIVLDVFSAWPAAALIADDEGDTPLHLALIYESPFKIVDGILTACPEAAQSKDGAGNTPLLRALGKEGTPDRITLRILASWTDSAKEVNTSGITPIQIAMSFNASEGVVQSLKSAAATSSEYQQGFKHLCQRMFFPDNSSPPPSPSASAAAEKVWSALKDDEFQGTTAAAVASAMSSKRMTTEAYASWIRENAACAEQQDQSGCTLLHHALEFGACVRTIQVTLDAWPSAARAVDERGNTPLHVAFLKEHPEAVLLAVLGASPEAALIANWQNETPVDYALSTQQSRATWNAVVATLAATSQDSGFDILVKILRKKSGTAETLEPAVQSIMALWPDAIKETTPIEKDWKGDITKGGENLLRIALQNDAPGAVLRAFLEQSPDITPLNDAPPQAIISLFEGLHMTQYSAEAADKHGWDFARIKFMSTGMSSVGHERSNLDRLSTLHKILPAEVVQRAFAACPDAVFESSMLQCHNSRKVGRIEMVASVNALRFEQLVSDCKLQAKVVEGDMSDTTPPTKTLASLRSILDVCFQSELSVSSTKSHSSVDYSPHMEMYIDPMIELIRDELAVFQTKVAVNPTLFRKRMLAMAMSDSAVYDQRFSQTLELQENGQITAYEIMLRKCADMQECCSSQEEDWDDEEQQHEQHQQSPCQPTAYVIPLVLMVRQNIPTFKRIVRLAFVEASESLSGNVLEIQFADQTKAPYRIIEKSFTKGPNLDYPDCSKVFDVFGCIIDCTDYKSMAAIFQAFIDRHNSGLLQMVRVIDRWTTPDVSGWRDLRLNLMIEGVIFEVQIVLHAMLSARSRITMCNAYSEFRSIAEVFKLLALPTDLDRNDFPFALEADEAVAAVVAPPVEAVVAAVVPRAEEMQAAAAAAAGSPMKAVNPLQLAAPHSFAVFAPPDMVGISESLAEFKVMEQEMAFASAESDDDGNELDKTVFINEEVDYEESGMEVHSTRTASTRTAARVAAKAAAEEGMLQKAQTAAKIQNHIMVCRMSEGSSDEESQGGSPKRGGMSPWRGSTPSRLVCAAVLTPDHQSMESSLAMSPPQQQTAGAVPQMEMMSPPPQQTAMPPSMEMTPPPLTAAPTPTRISEGAPGSLGRLKAQKMPLSPVTIILPPNSLAAAAAGQQQGQLQRFSVRDLIDHGNAAEEAEAPEVQVQAVGQALQDVVDVSAAALEILEPTDQSQRQEHEHEHEQEDIMPALERVEHEQEHEQGEDGEDEHGTEAAENEEQREAASSSGVATSSVWEFPPSPQQDIVSREDELEAEIKLLRAQSAKEIQRLRSVTSAQNEAMEASNARIHNLEQVVALLCKHNGLAI